MAADQGCFTGVYLHRAQQGVFPPQEVLFPPKNLQQTSLKIMIPFFYLTGKTLVLTVLHRSTTYICSKS